MAGLKPEMAGLKPEVGLDSPSIRGGVVTLTDRPRNPASSFWAASAKGFLSMASEAERLRKREISSWILPALNTAPGMEAILFWYFAVARNDLKSVERNAFFGKIVLEYTGIEANENDEIRLLQINAAD